MASAMFSSVLFTACTKDSDPVTPQNNSVSTASPAEKQLPPKFHMNSATLGARNLTMYSGSGPFYSMPRPISLDLLGPISQLPDIENHFTTYYPFSISTGVETELRLEGFADINGQVTPIVFTLDQIRSIDASAISKHLEETDNVFSLYNVVADKLFNGLTAEMIDGAIKTGNVVMASRTQNPEVFNLIYNNLDKKMDVR